MVLPLVWLANELKAEGLTVTEHSGWKTRSDPRNVYNGELVPVGVIDHHTAGSSILTNYPEPPYWTDTRLETACNITIRPDGTLSVLNAGIAYDSGLGSRKVYDAVRLDKPLPPLAGLVSDMNGTLHFIDIEVQHRGDGGPIDPRQYDTLIRTNAVICDHYGWDPTTRVIGHREWAPDRKIDPQWNGRTNPMPGIRLDTLTAMEEDMTPEQMEALAQRSSDLSVSKLMAHRLWATSYQGQRVPFEQAVSRDHRNITELVNAYRADQFTDMTDEQLSELAAAVNDELARRVTQR